MPFRNRRGQFTDDGNQDFGLFDITEADGDIYKFRTAPLHNLAVQPAFVHNGSFVSLTDALQHHLDALGMAKYYDPVAEGVATDLTQNIDPILRVLQRLDPALAQPVILSDAEFSNLLAFVRDGLSDPRAQPENLARLIPASVPSGLPLQVFESTPPGP